MSFGHFLAGSVELIAVAAAMAFAAVRLRRRLLPGWSGASARLAEVILGLSQLVLTLELVGVVGLYRPGFVLVAAIAGGAVVGFWAQGRPGRPAVPLPSPAIAPYALAIATAAAALVTLHWAMPTQTGLDIGMYLPNTTWHNAPFAARFVQDHQVGALHFTEVLRLTVWFYPQNSELLHSAGELFLGTDFLSPLLNIGWMALCLLAAWCFGRPYGAAATALLGVALVVDAEMLLLYQPGDAKNDIGGLFFLIASAAILINADAQSRAGAASARPIAGAAREGPARGETRAAGSAPARPGLMSGAAGLRPEIAEAAIVVSGLAAGLALGTKLNLLAPFGLLTLGVIWAAAPTRRLRTTMIWAGSALLTGGFWFARNLIETGNPLPWFDSGPLSGPAQLKIDIREPHTVADYLTNLHVIRHSLIPGIHHSFGILWPLTLAVLLGGIVLALWRGRTPIVRMLGVVGALSAIAYLFTPLTAAGPLNDPTAFEVNIRYGSPALALGGMLLAIDPALSRGRAFRWLLGLLAAMLLISALPIDAFENVWRARFLVGGLGLAAVIVGVPVGLALAGQRGASRGLIAAGVALALVIVVGVGWRENRDYLDGRYQAATAPDDFPEGMRHALEWFNGADLHHTRIAVVGGKPGFKQYIFYGNDLSNRVQYVAHRGPHGAYTPIMTCQEWRRALNEGGYSYVVIGPDQRTQHAPPVEAQWTRTDPSARLLLSTNDLISVFELDGSLDPSTCAKPDGAGASSARKPAGWGSGTPTEQL
jgi:hypothetical protein